MTPPLAYEANPARFRLGVGMDLPWGEAIGFVRDHAARDRVAPRVRAFLRQHAAHFGDLFFAFQPRGREVFHIDDYAAAYDDLFAAAPELQVHALHHTALNMGAPIGPMRAPRSPASPTTSSVATTSAGSSRTSGFGPYAAR